STTLVPPTRQTTTPRPSLAGPAPELLSPPGRRTKKLPPALCRSIVGPAHHCTRRSARAASYHLKRLAIYAPCRYRRFAAGHARIQRHIPRLETGKWPERSGPAAEDCRPRSSRKPAIHSALRTSKLHIGRSKILSEAVHPCLPLWQRRGSWREHLCSSILLL